jgi:hypothetical protein
MIGWLVDCLVDEIADFEIFFVDANDGMSFARGLSMLFKDKHDSAASVDQLRPSMEYSWQYFILALFFSCATNQRRIFGVSQNGRLSIFQTVSSSRISHSSLESLPDKFVSHYMGRHQILDSYTRYIYG